MVIRRETRVEIHCHTEYSFDGQIGIGSLFRTARKCRLDAVAITDHDTIEGAIEAKKWAKRKGTVEVEVIVGEEKTLEDGSHIIGLFLKEELYSSRFEDVISEIREQNGLCFIPHPFRQKDGLLRDQSITEVDLGRIGGAVEAFNAKLSGRLNEKAARKLGGFPWVVGSDAHYECDLGEAVNVMKWKGSLRETIQAVFDGRESAQYLVKRQQSFSEEREYAPTYYKLKRFVRVPRFLLPLAKEGYRRYRNLRFGVGEKNLTVLREDQ